MKSETKFKVTTIYPFLKTLKNCCYFTIQQASISGTPDMMVCINGVFFALEIKSERGKPSPLQTYNLAQINRCGGVGLLVYPENWNDIKKLLQRADIKRGVLHGASSGH